MYVYKLNRSMSNLMVDIGYYSFFIKVRKKAKIRNRYNQVSPMTQDTKWEREKNTRKHHTQKSQEASSIPAGDRKKIWGKRILQKYREKLHYKKTADSVLLSLFMRTNGKCNNSHAPLSGILPSVRAQYS